MRVRVSLLLRVGLPPQAAVQVSQSREVVAGHDVLASPNYDPDLHLPEALRTCIYVDRGADARGGPGVWYSRVAPSFLEAPSLLGGALCLRRQPTSSLLVKAKRCDRYTVSRSVV